MKNWSEEVRAGGYCQIIPRAYNQLEAPPRAIEIKNQTTTEIKEPNLAEK